MTFIASCARSTETPGFSLAITWKKYPPPLSCVGMRNGTSAGRGTHTCNCPNGNALASSGSTPMIVYGRPSSVMDWPTTKSSFPLKWRFRKRRLMSATCSPPGRSSSAEKLRPGFGACPSAGSISADAKSAPSCSGSPLPVSVNAPKVARAMWLNTSWRSRTSRKRGYEKPTRVKALAKTQHLPCQAWYEVDPVVVPPTTSKVEHQRVLDKVWRRAGQRLSEADSVYLVGYSWPQADQFFHQLYAVGSVGTQLLKRFCVVNHDQPVHERIRNELLGQQAADRFETLSKPEHRFD